MDNVHTHLKACGQLCKDHPLIRLIQQCLHNGPHKRPNIREVLCLLEEAKAGIRDEESERNKYELVQALQNEPMNQVRVLTLIFILLVYLLTEFRVYFSRLGNRKYRPSVSCAGGC